MRIRDFGRAARNMAAVFALAGLVGLSSMVASAATGTANGNINIRQQATVNSSAIGSLTNGTSVTLGEAVTNDAGETWYQITTSGGQTGYVRSDLITITEETPASGTGETGNTGSDVPSAMGDGYAASMTPTNATVTSDVNIRSGAGTDYGKLGTLTAGTTLVLIGQAKDSSGDVWYQFYSTNTPQQMTGFIRYDYISIGEPLQQMTEVVPAAPSDSAGTERPQYQAVYTADESGQDTWYLYDNQSNTRKKISDINKAIQEAQDAAIEAQGKAGSMRTLAIIFGVALIAAIAGLVLMFIQMRRNRTEGDEVDLMKIRQGQQRRRPETGAKKEGTGIGIRGRSQEGGAARNSREGAQRSAYPTRKPAEQQHAEGAPKRPASPAGQGQARPQAADAQARQRAPQGQDGDVRVRQPRPEGEMRRRPAEGAGAPQRPHEGAEGAARPAQNPVREGAAEVRRDVRAAQGAVRTAEGAVRNEAHQVRRAAQNFADVDEEFQFMDVDGK